MIKLKELFNKTYPYEEIEPDTPGEYDLAFQFETPYEDIYNVNITTLLFKEARLYIGRNIDDVLRESGYSMEDELVDVEFGKFNKRGDITYELSSTKDYITVLSTIIEIVKNAKIPPTITISFSAKEKSRIKLYDTLAKKFKRTRDKVYNTFGANGNKYYFLIPEKQ